MKFKRKCKKMLSLLLIIFLLFSLLPMKSEAASEKNIPKKIVLNSSKLTMFKGQSKTLKVKKVLPFKASKDVTWSSSNKRVATVTSKGKVKAKKAGTTKIIAKSKKNERVKASCKINIYNKTKKIKLLSKSAYTLNTGESVKLKAKVISPTTKTEPITWKSNNKSVATVSKTGMVKAIRAGTATMTATSGEKRVKVKIDVKKAENPITYYTVTFVSEAMDVSNLPTVQKILSGARAVRPADPVRKGYEFAGWYTNRTLTIGYNFDNAVTKNITLYAKWVKYTEPVHDPDLLCHITFDLNDGSESVYEIQKVKEGSLVTLPDDPERKLYRFTGWYIDPAAVTNYNFNSPVNGDLVLYAGWGSPDGSTDTLYSASDKEETIYSITGLEMDENMVYATINTNSACALVVEFFEDNIGVEGTWEEETVKACLQGEPITRIATQTPDYGELINVSIPVEAALPEHYFIRSRLVELDNENQALDLCEPYICIDYTARYAKFEEQKASDFPEEKVVNFDESTENNFGVLNENVKRIISDDTINTLIVEDIFIEDETNGNMLDHTYTFLNPDDTITTLQEGDSVYVIGTNYLFMIGNIVKNSDGTITFTTASDAMLTDFYDVLKTDMEAVDNDIQPQADIIDVDTSLSASLGGDISIEPIKDRLKITGKLSGTAKVDIKIAYDAKLLAKDYFECNITTSTETKIGIEGKVFANNDEVVDKIWKATRQEIKLPKVLIPTPVPGLEAYVYPTVPIEWEVSGSVSVEYTSTQKSGFKYNTYSGREDIKEKSQSVSLKAEGKAEVKAGPKLSIGIQFLKDTVKAEISGQAGAKVTATVETGSDDLSNHVESKHACYLCVSGEAKWFVNVNAKLSYKIWEDKIEGDVFNLKLDLEGYVNFLPKYPGEFFVSILNSKESSFGGGFKFGFGPCTNKSYRTEIKTTTDNEAILKDIPVTVKKQDGGTSAEKTGNSTYVAYLYDGIYTASAEIEGKRASKSFVTKGNAQTVILSPSSDNGGLTGHIKDSETGENIQGASIKVSKDGLVVTSTESEASGKFSYSLPDGEFLIEITKDGYIPFSSYEKIENGQSTYMQEIELIPGGGKGGFRGVITDAVTGESVDNVTLQIRSSWNNTTGKIIKEIKTNSDGEFKYGTQKLFGVLFGIPCGNYTLTASKEDYMPTSFNIIVRPGEDEDNPEQNGIMSPTLSEGDTYRIVLTWGENPRDLDSHVVGNLSDGSRFHVYYQNMSEYDYDLDTEVCNLDLDDTTSYGPETITLNVNNDRPYYYYIYHYAGSGTLSTSGAQIKVYHGNDSVRTFNVPTGFEDEDYWNVFAIVDGRIVPKNTLTFSSDITYAESNRAFETFKAGSVKTPISDTSAEDKAPKK